MNAPAAIESQSQQSQAVPPQSVAAHEAGHAVACLVQGIKVRAIWVKGVNADVDTVIRAQIGDENFTAHTGFCHSDTADGIAEAISSLAGIAAECIALNTTLDEYIDRGAAGDSSLQGGSDLDDVMDSVNDWDAVIEAYDAAHALLTEHADAHRRMTDLLMERGILTYAEIVVCGRHRGKSWDENEFMNRQRRDKPLIEHGSDRQQASPSHSPKHRSVPQAEQARSQTSGRHSSAGAHSVSLTNSTRVPQARHDSTIRNIPAGRVWVPKISRLLVRSVRF